MNLLHMKYAVEIANVRSINKAAETLYVGQSALSRAVKELETSLGAKLFERSSKGVVLTPEGELFIRYAKAVLEQVDDLESIFRSGMTTKKKFSIAATRSSYAAEAFAGFSRLVGESAELVYSEVSSMQALKAVAADEYKLGLVRYAGIYENYYRSVIAARGLECESIAVFPYKIVVSTDSPLAKKEVVTSSDLSALVQVAHSDPYLPSPPTEAKKAGASPLPTRVIYVGERASRFEILSRNPETYAWVSPIPADTLRRYSLVERFVDGEERTFCDMLIRRADYLPTSLDELFIDELKRAKDALMSE